MFVYQKKPICLTTLNQQGGFTLLELLVVIAIIAITLTVAMPNVVQTLERQRNKEVAQSVFYAFKEARTESFLRKHDIEVEFTDTQITVRKLGATQPINTYSINAKTPIVSQSTSIIFQSNKRVRDGSSSARQKFTFVTYCNDTKSKEGRTVELDVNANVVVKTENSKC